MEVWYHGPMSRAEAELLLEDEGDFLVRESKSKAGQYVLSGVQNSQPRHLLLVDPQGKVLWYAPLQWNKYLYINRVSLRASSPERSGGGVFPLPYPTPGTPWRACSQAKTANSPMIRLRAVSLFSWSVEQNAGDTQMTTRVTEGARRERHVSRVSRLRLSTLARACTPLTKSEEKERLLAFYPMICSCW